MRLQLPINLLKYTAYLLLLIVMGCAVDVEDSREEEDHPRVLYDKMSENPLVTYILEPGNELSVKNSNHIRKTLNYTPAHLASPQVKSPPCRGGFFIELATLTRYN